MLKTFGALKTDCSLQRVLNETVEGIEDICHCKLCPARTSTIAGSIPCFQKFCMHSMQQK